MAITFVNVGANDNDTSGAGTSVALTPPLPASVASGDLLLIAVLALGGTGPDAEATASGYTLVSDGVTDAYVEANPGTGANRSLWILYKFHDGSETDPTVNITGMGTTCLGMAAMAAYRGVDPSTPVEEVLTDFTNSTSATYSTDDVTSITDDAWAIDFVASADENALDLTTTEGFTARMSGAGYDTTTAQNGSIGWADIEVASAGTVPYGVWTQTVNGNDTWASIGIILKPEASGISAAIGLATSTEEAFQVSARLTSPWTDPIEVTVYAGVDQVSETDLAQPLTWVGTSYGYNDDVTMVVRFAFGNGIYATAPQWVDVTQHVRGFTVQRGRSRLLDQMQPGAARIVLSNDSGDYYPWNTQSDYSGDINVLTRVNIQASYLGTDYDLFTGYVTAWPSTWPATGKDSVTVVEAVDGFHLLAMYETELTTGTALTGLRIGSLLNTAGWPVAWRDLDAGVHLTAPLVSEFNTVLDEIQRAAQVEDGLFYIDGGGNAVFRDGTTRLLTSSAGTLFTDDGSDRYYADLRVDYDDTQLWNSATVTRTDGTAQTADDLTSQELYGTRHLHLSGTVHYSDGEANAYAEWMVAEFKDVRPRIPEIMLIPERDPALLWPRALGLDFLAKVAVQRNDINGDPLDIACFVEGITHDVNMVGERSWKTTFQLSPDVPFDDWWILGTSELGTNTRLSY